jgi:hypothetical protein
MFASGWGKREQLRARTGAKGFVFWMWCGAHAVVVHKVLLCLVRETCCTQQLIKRARHKFIRGRPRAGLSLHQGHTGEGGEVYLRHQGHTAEGDEVYLRSLAVNLAPRQVYCHH